MASRKVKARQTDEQLVCDDGAAAAEPAIVASAAAPGSSWMSHISYYQEYMTVIELEETPAAGIRHAS